MFIARIRGYNPVEDLQTFEAAEKMVRENLGKEKFPIKTPTDGYIRVNGHLGGFYITSIVIYPTGRWDASQCGGWGVLAGIGGNDWNSVATAFELAGISTTQREEDSQFRSVSALAEIAKTGIAVEFPKNRE